MKTVTFELEDEAYTALETIAQDEGREAYAQAKIIVREVLGFYKPKTMTKVQHPASSTPSRPSRTRPSRAHSVAPQLGSHPHDVSA